MIVASIAMPWPDRALSPNGRAHHMVKARAVKAQRAVADALAREKGLHLMPFPEALDIRMTLIVCPKPRGRYPDDDNIIACMKGARDAIAAAMRVDDARFRVMPVQRGERCRDGAVIVQVEAR